MPSRKRKQPDKYTPAQIFTPDNKVIPNSKGSKSGKGLTKELTSNTVEYKYWNSLDELLERLYVLYGEVKARNTNPSLRNEIINILEEIKEEKTK